MRDTNDFQVLRDIYDVQVKHNSNKTDQAQFTTKCSANLVFLNLVTFAEVKRVLGSIKPKRSSGVDHIPSSLIRNFSDPVIDILVRLINLTFTTGIFPTLQKHAKVAPLFEKGNKLNLTNYRPISVLNSISKILEKLFHKRMMYLYMNKLLSYFLFGFRRNYTTS